MTLDPLQRDNIPSDPVLAHEYRERNGAHASQWYFDEFSGLYRQHAPAEESSSTYSPRQTQLSALPPPSSPFLPSNAAQQQPVEKPGLWPIPETLEQVNTLREQARAIGDPQAQLEFCFAVMEGAWRLRERYGNGCGTASQEDSIRRKKKRKRTELALHQIMGVEAQRILKNLATVSPAMGKSGYSEAQFVLANCYGIGALGLRADLERAFLWYLQASKQNHPKATYRTAVCYELGIGTRIDQARARTFYRKAAHLSHNLSMYKLGIILIRGCCGQKRNLREGLSWLQRAAADAATSKNPQALYALGMIHLNNDDCRQTSLIADPQYGIELLHQGAHMGHPPCQVKLGELYEIGADVDLDDPTSISWYVEACEAKSAEAALGMSGWYLSGSPDYLEQSDSIAYAWARKAAKFAISPPSIARAYYFLGIFAEHGIGTKTSISEAVKCYQKAAAHGHAGAYKRLKSLQ
ncbi:hypothetical protein DFQ28_001713 [Apophysomyces sp. BC1034]|nr:hypothetical protein DFQ30_006005 [Apophysomyces sp. BC1015]KAG0180116.1 hypothetical protein DFQ29_001218 [Apophysomyces sp. BC1021]KAG0190685.1 hypothetical protein DFQ28_001713 [Apophysomyces sp. BC1034]